MQISLILETGKRINPGDKVPLDAIIGNTSEHPNKHKIVLNEVPNDLREKPNVLIRGKSYIINKRHYDLDSGYALRASLTQDGMLTPVLRDARGAERRIFQKVEQDNRHVPKKRVGSINEVWPEIERIWKDDKNTRD
jgi:hypothetical protein